MARAALEAMRTLGLGGLSVTMPHKEDAARACDELTPDAAALGAVNTVVPGEHGRCSATSTDGEGFLRSVRDDGVDPAGRPRARARRRRRGACDRPRARRERAPTSRSRRRRLDAAETAAGLVAGVQAVDARRRATRRAFDAGRERHAARDAGRGAADRPGTPQPRASSWSTPCTTRWRRRCSPPPAPGASRCANGLGHARAPGRARVRAVDRGRRAARRDARPRPSMSRVRDRRARRRLCASLGLVVGWMLDPVIARVPREVPVLRTAAPRRCVAGSIARGGWWSRAVRRAVRRDRPRASTTRGRCPRTWCSPRRSSRSSVIDLEHLLLPNRIVYPLDRPRSSCCSRSASLGDDDVDAFVRALLARRGRVRASSSCCTSSRRASMGFGDVKLSFVLGLVARLARLGRGGPRPVPRLRLRRGRRARADR